MRKQFYEYHKRTQRWAVLVCHRRSGKTTATLNDLILKACKPKDGEARYAFVAPYFSQAKDIAWGYLKRYSEPLWAGEPNETELRVDFVNGARIRLYGADNPDRLRGLGFDGVVCDEFADWRSGVWDEVVRPTLLDRQGFATFIGTPKGKNEFYETYERARDNPSWFRMMLKGSESHLIPDDELQHLRDTMDPDAYNQEIECSFEASLKGSYYTEEMSRAHGESRIGRVPVDRSLKVDTAWDLGYSDSTAIWFIQSVGKERRFVDYYEASGVGFDHYAKVLNDKKYVYGDHYFPHDISAKMIGMDKSRLETLRSLGIEATVVPQGSVQDGINAVRGILNQAWFDEKKCERGLECLKAYRKEWDDMHKCWRDKPVHDWSSHGADAIRTFATGFQEKHPIVNYRRLSQPTSSGWQSV
jgi:hypothetical protein